MIFLKALILTTGFLLVGLGTVGIFLPLLPTTPLYLLAAFCFAKSSKRFHLWFTSTKLYKKHLESFAKTRSMTLKTKLVILISVTIMLIIPWLLLEVAIMRIAIVVLLLIKYWCFIFKIKTITPDENEKEGVEWHTL